MVTRSNQSKFHTDQLNKKKSPVQSEDKLPHRIFEDVKDLFTYFDQDTSGFINFSQLKSILHYITGGILQRKVLENFIFESLQKTSNFEFDDVEKLSLKLWDEIGNEQAKKEINNIFKTLDPYTTKDELEEALKSKLK